MFSTGGSSETISTGISEEGTGNIECPANTIAIAEALATKSAIPYNTAEDAISYSSYQIEMFHLVKDTVDHIENNLIYVKHVQDSIFSMWFNIILFVGVVGSFFFFLYTSHGTATPDELKAINFEPNLWNNAVRNVPITDYGQTPQIETRNDIQGYPYRSGATAF